MGEFGAVSVLSGHLRGKTNTLPLHIEILFNEFKTVPAFAVSAILVIMAVIILIIRSVIEYKGNIPQNAMSVLADGIEVYIPFEELVDLEAEKQRLQGEREKLLSEVARGEKMLSNPGFVNKAPEAKINEEKAKLAKYKEMLKKVEERIKSI